jgi:hypothetical protein
MTSNLVGRLDVHVLRDVVNNNGPFLTSLLNEMNPQVLANALATPQAKSFLIALLDQAPGDRLNPGVVANIVNSNQTWVTSLVGDLDPSTVSVPLNSSQGKDFTERLLNNGLDPAVVANLLNNNSGFISDLLDPSKGALDAGVVADAVNNNQTFLEQMMTDINPSDLTYDINTNPGVQAFVNQLVGVLDPATLAQAVSENTAMVSSMLAAPPQGIDPDILTPILNAPETRDFVSGLMADLDAGSTSTMLQNSDQFLFNLLNWDSGSGGGLDPQVLVNAMAGPSNAGTNPVTGTAWDPSQNVLRKVWMRASVEIVFGWVLPPMEAFVQIEDGRMNTTPGTPNDPWLPY